ncbi:MAG: phosphoribosylamine--glycine ligase [Saprospiraceae bacterium]|nr:phosphoribosylamine--glycine ligase [Saprospiraceae bacterium]
MKILLLGSGGREHALAWKMVQSPLCSKLFIAPGNAGTRLCGENISLNINDFNAVKSFVLSNEIEMVVVGPEEPLVLGIYDFFKQDASLQNIPVIGPSKEGAKLEGSKAFAKEFMMEMKIPTAAYQEFNGQNLKEGLAYIATQTPPIVLKADGLAAGKGVVILPEIEAAQQELSEMLAGKFGNASSKVVIEQFLSGIEFSVFVLTDGNTYQILPVAKDYKRVGEGDKGLNTGGMGAVSPVPFVDDEMMKKVEDRIIIPTINGLKKRNIEYKGFVFIGLISVEGEPYVIEYNCRMGDPETEVVIPRLENDLVDLFVALNDGTLATKTIQSNPDFATTIMLVSGGYPEHYEKGKKVQNLEAIEKGLVFHAGTTQKDTDIVTAGGRVLALTSFGKTMEEALSISNKNADTIDFEGKYFRKDIGFDLQ